MEHKHTTDIGEPGAEPAVQPAEPPDRAHTAAPGSDDTIANKPHTVDLVRRPDVKRSTRCGDVFLGEKATIQFTVPWRGATAALTVEIRDRIVIGRAASKVSSKPDVNLSRYGGYIHGVSRCHVAITKDSNILMVTDLGSKNGTYLNGAKLNPHQPRVLRSGDELHLGSLPVRVTFGPTGTLT